MRPRRDTDTIGSRSISCGNIRFQEITAIFLPGRSCSPFATRTPLRLELSADVRTTGASAGSNTKNREVPLSSETWLYGIEKAGRYIRQYRTIILVEGIFDYFAFYNLLRDQDKPVVVSTLGTYLGPRGGEGSKTF